MEARTGSAELILAGPRGRRFCLMVSGVSVFSLQAAELDKSDTSPPNANDKGPIRWVEDPPINERVAESVAAAVSNTRLQRRSANLTDQETFHCLSAATQSAMYWEPPDDEDQLAAMAPVIAALRPIAETAARSASTAWWTQDLQLHDQHFVSWIQSTKGRRARAPMLTGAAERLKSWRRAALGPSSWWWSFPDAVSTSPSHATLPATQLDLLEDSLGFTRARVARLEPTAGCRVLELTTPQDWVDLVGTHPLDVTRSRDQFWPDVTGGQGPWFIPDWLAVSRDYDAVHLSVLAYLSTAGRALPCRGDSTVLAGWEPDVTYWLTDSLSQAETPTTWKDTWQDENADREALTTWVPA